MVLDQRLMCFNEQKYLGKDMIPLRKNTSKKIVAILALTLIWRNTNAVRNNRVHMLDSTLITHMPLGLSIIDAFEHVADILYPQAGIR